MQAAMESGAFAQMLTTMMPLSRPGYPDEIAKAMLFLGIRHRQLHQRRQSDRRWRTDPKVRPRNKPSALSLNWRARMSVPSAMTLRRIT